MPLAVDNLTPKSTDQQIQDAISETIKKLMEEGKDQKAAAGQAYSMARQATGKELNYGK